MPKLKKRLKPLPEIISPDQLAKIYKHGTAERNEPGYTPTTKDRQTVVLLVCAQLPQIRIARVVGIALDTLHRHYSFELENGADLANSAVLGTLFRLAVSGEHPAATFFWTKCRLRWRESDRLEITGANGGPIQTDHKATIDLTKLNREQLHALKDIVDTAAPPPRSGDDSNSAVARLPI